MEQTIIGDIYVIFVKYLHSFLIGVTII